MEAGGPLGTSNASPSGQFLSAPCLAQRTFAVYFASHHPTQPLGSKITQHYDFPRADCRLNLKRDKPILTHSACPPPMPPRHLWHPGSCLTGWLESESNKRHCPLAMCPAPEPAWHTQAQDVPVQWVCHSLLASQVDQLIFHHLVVSHVQIPGDWTGLDPEKALAPPIQLPRNSHPDTHSTQGLLNQCRSLYHPRCVTCPRTDPRMPHVYTPQPTRPGSQEGHSIYKEAIHSAISAQRRTTSPETTRES